MLVSIASFSFPHEAHVARALLESEGIPVIVADEHTINMQWLYSDALGGVKIQVPPEHQVAATELLKSEFSANLINQQDLEPEVCKECGSSQIEYRVKGKKLGLLSIILLQLPFCSIKHQVHCLNCNQTFEP
ncbi:MAG: DUF2007 domain-containing protein [Gammaproteobacteria bacterium]|nr:DUF2007 domain-containing protein [Gammaproteobacteria bacterium]